jgi:hypothetical protein
MDGREPTAPTPIEIGLYDVEDEAGDVLEQLRLAPLPAYLRCLGCSARVKEGLADEARGVFLCHRCHECDGCGAFLITAQDTECEYCTRHFCRRCMAGPDWVCPCRGHECSRCQACLLKAPMTLPTDIDQNAGLQTEYWLTCPRCWRVHCRPCAVHAGDITDGRLCIECDIQTGRDEIRRIAYHTRSSSIRAFLASLPKPPAN